MPSVLMLPSLVLLTITMSSDDTMIHVNVVVVLSLDEVVVDVPL